MYQIHVTITPAGFTRLDLDTPRIEYGEADSFFSYLEKHLQELEERAQAWRAEHDVSMSQGPKSERS